MRLLGRPRLRVCVILVSIAGISVILAFVRPEIDAADAQRIATNPLFVALAKDHPESPRPQYLHTVTEAAFSINPSP